MIFLLMLPSLRVIQGFICTLRFEAVDNDEIKKKNLKKMLMFSICLASNLGGIHETHLLVFIASIDVVFHDCI